MLLSLQAIANDMDAQNERLGWLNKHAPQVLASPGVSPQSRDQHVGKLRSINLKWSKVKLVLPLKWNFLLCSLTYSSSCLFEFPEASKTFF